MSYEATKLWFLMKINVYVLCRNCTHTFVYWVGFFPECNIDNDLILHPAHVVDVRKGIRLCKLLQYSSLTLLERECCEGKSKPIGKQTIN